jgi:energy-coupling factor transporter ATP-binding protein EcfA2
MTQLTNLDAAELTTWLTRVTQTIDRSLRDPARTEATAALREGLKTRAGLPVLTQLALLDDCLRVAHLAIEADGLAEEDELARVTELVRVAAEKYFAALPQYEAFGDGAGNPEDVEAFLRAHRADEGPFGFLHEQPWRGLHLARLVEQHTRNASPLRDHERMLARIMDAVFGGRATDVERSARRRLRELFEPKASGGTDPRVTAFCRDDGPEVFSSVAHGSQIFERDPFDVESIHAEARELFHRQIERATTPEQHSRGHGRTLLVLGESGCGKTHLLRALRTQTHAQRLGYVGYLQMASEVGDYSRYVLRNLIDSLERPYDPPALSESGLMYLSDGLAEGRVPIPATELEQLRTAELTSDELDAVVGGIIDRIVRTEGLERLEVDILHALLLLQRRDPAIQRRVVRFLRCEALTAYDRKLLGGLSARQQPEDPLRTIQQLASVMYELHMAALVLVVDQIEETIPDGHTVTRLQQAFDSLRAIADATPSAVIVISCLEDVYDTVRPRLSRSLVDRLERDPTPVRLTSQRHPDEIEQMLVRRLEFLFASFDIAWRDDEPLFPFTAEQLEAVSHFRARDCLAKFREYHAACIAAGRLVPPVADPTAAVMVPVAPAWALTTPGVTSPELRPPANFAELERAWNDAIASSAALPDDDDALLAFVEQAIRDAAGEAELSLITRRTGSGSTHQLHIEGPTIGHRVVAMTNRPPQGGHLGKQLETLRKVVNTGAIPIALRNSDFQFKAKSAISQRVGELIAAGGRTVVLEERELRTIRAARDLVDANPPNFAEWRRIKRPITRLSFVRQILDLDRTPMPLPAVEISEPHPVSASALKAVPQPARTPSGPVAAIDPAQIKIGVTTTMRAEPQYLTLDQIKTHVAFLGGTGSGKTTAALNVIEQLLERGVSALLLDRKGDLSRYATDAWWRDAEHPDRARKAQLRSRIDIGLFTPGNSAGRPLRLPLVPPLVDANAQERDQLAKFAASGLAAMMGYGTSSTHQHKQSVLQCAIQLQAEEREVGLDLLLDTINRPDPDLLATVGSLQRFFAGLSEDLQSLRIQRGSLLIGDGEALDVGALLPAPGAKPRLTIINTSALTEIPVLQFWVSRLLIELARLARKRPTKELQAVAFFDEADAYVPAVGSPPTKEPMFDLLRRARSGGLGVLLATQNPGDFDYKARDNIGTWLVGKVAQDRAIEKMRNLLGSYPQVASRLATQPTGHFFVLANGRAAEIKCDRSLMQTEQLSDADVIEVAKRRS